MKGKIIYIIMTLIEIGIITASIVICGATQRELKTFPILQSKNEILEAMNGEKQYYAVIDAPLSGRTTDDPMGYFLAAKIKDGNPLYIAYKKEQDDAYYDDLAAIKYDTVSAARDVHIYDNIYLRPLNEYLFDGKTILIDVQDDNYDKIARYRVNYLTADDKITCFALIGDKTFNIVRLDNTYHDFLINATYDKLIHDSENNTIICIILSLVIYVAIMVVSSIFIDFSNKHPNSR